MLMLFLAENPIVWIVIAGLIFLLFGGSKLPQLAKALGQSKRSFKEGLEESEDKDKSPQQPEKQVEIPAENKASLESIDDETLFAEAHRRARLQGRETKG